MTGVDVVPVALGARSYEVRIESGLLARAADHLAPLARKRPFAIVTDANVAPHAQMLRKSLSVAGFASELIVLPAGESTKSWAQLEALTDRLLGLDNGADDYLPKPFAFAELIARCRALLRRPNWAAGRNLQCGDLQLDTRARIAVRSGQEIRLTPREVDVLEYLMRNQGQTVTREMLERDVWKQVHRMTSLDNVIDVQMMRLRKKVDFPGVDRLIHTQRGIGYKMERLGP